ncbi:CDP-alcohol phosphatidyltransferase [Rubrobacter xylanophilus]|uniref:Bifunctional IPC transferase and DIPP synthase n=1 Tax=Rubrobacter xylanophilus TaxID=49319 RepID=A0A510HK06_9ACTN|nr:NTP transferase domain-containing protein [Rubrobacter xylanophilus]BBL78667.1 CDP-alcohol phosphatidyltransferase [Rubrobacter xylanophilus]
MPETERRGDSVGAAVLAAGFGERLRECGCPKPLARVAGLTLLERTVRTLRAGGLDGEIAVVVGHRGEEVTGYCKERGLPVRVVENPDYPRGNGTSVLAAMRFLPERFVVAMVDHVHTPDSVRRLLGCEGDFVAAVDTRPVYADPGEATRVRIEDGRVVDFGKKLPEYDGLDAGLFLCSRSALGRLREAAGQERLSWNDLKRAWLASGGEVVACDLAGAPWTDVDTPRDLRLSEEMVLGWAASGNDGPISRHINRRISRRITRRLLDAPLSPDQVSLLSFALAALGAGLLAAGRLRLGGVLVQLASVVDGCDGELARARVESSPRGAVFDATLDRWADALIISGLALGAGTRRAAVAGYPALAGALLVSYTRARWEAALGRMPSRFTGLGATRDVRLAVLALGGMLRAPVAALLATGILGNAEALRRLLALKKERT